MTRRALDMAVEGMGILRKWRRQKKISITDYEEMKGIFVVNTTADRIARRRRMQEIARIKPRIKSVITRAKAVPIIVELYKKDRHVRELREMVGGSAQTVVKRIRELEKAGIVKTVKELWWPYRKVVSLTDRGKFAFRNLLGPAAGAGLLEMEEDMYE